MSTQNVVLLVIAFVIAVMSAAIQGGMFRRRLLGVPRLRPVAAFAAFGLVVAVIAAAFSGDRAASPRCESGKHGDDRAC
jgi:hypothetical protein